MSSLNARVSTRRVGACRPCPPARSACRLLRERMSPLRPAGMPRRSASRHSVRTSRPSTHKSTTNTLADHPPASRPPERANRPSKPLLAGGSTIRTDYLPASRPLKNVGRAPRHRNQMARPNSQSRRDEAGQPATTSIPPALRAGHNGAQLKRARRQDFEPRLRADGAEETSIRSRRGRTGAVPPARAGVVRPGCSVPGSRSASCRSLRSPR